MHGAAMMGFMVGQEGSCSVGCKQFVFVLLTSCWWDGCVEYRDRSA